MGKLYKQEGSGHGSSETFPESTYPWHKVTTWPLPPGCPGDSGPLAPLTPLGHCRMPPWMQLNPFWTLLSVPHTHPEVAAVSVLPQDTGERGFMDRELETLCQRHPLPSQGKSIFPQAGQEHPVPELEPSAANPQGPWEDLNPNLSLFTLFSSLSAFHSKVRPEMNTSPTFHHHLQHLPGTAASSKHHSSQQTVTLCSYAHPSFPHSPDGLSVYADLCCLVPATYEMVPPGEVLFQSSDLKGPQILSLLWFPPAGVAGLLPTMAAKPWVVTG